MKMHSKFRRYALSTLALAATSFWSPWTLAQDSSSDADEVLEEVTVTGSRLSRTGFDTPTPTVVIGAAEVGAATSPALGDLLNEMPQLRTTFGLSNSSRFIGTAGVGALDLRGLGTSRTLVLINGRRHVSSTDGSQRVDVNSIPTDMIERIEVITGANSAVYGADAVAGVVNFILKDDYEGTSLRASIGEADDSPFGRTSAAFTMGRNFANDRGNAVFSVGFDDQDLLTAGQRGGQHTRLLGEITNPADGDTIDANGIQIDDGIPDSITVPNQGFWAISNAGASLTLNGFLNPDGSFSPVPFSSFEFTDGLECGGVGCTALDLDSFEVLQAEFQRVTLDANFTYDLTDEVTWFFESRYASVETSQQGQPTFDFGSPVVIQRDNAFVTPSLGAAMDAAGVASTDLRRFNIDLGLRTEDNNRETFRAVTGLRGNIGQSGYNFETFVNYGRSTIERINLGNRIDERWAAAQDAIVVDAAGATAIGNGVQDGDVVCRATLQEALNAADPVANPTDSGLPDFAFNGCIPANVVGLGLISPEAQAWINSTALGLSEVQQLQAQVVVSNSDLIDLWAGPLGAVLGFEFRDEDSLARGDSLSALGNTFFNNLASTVGDFNVREVFTEFSLPLLRDVPFAEDLTLEGAARFSDYSTIGNTFTWEARLNWQPIEDLRFRFNVGEALRAPTISDLFSPAGENFATVDDPCDMANLDEGNNGRTVRIANCQALGIADPVNFDSLDEESITLKQGGNPNIREEIADTFTIGLVYTPRWAEDLQISLDWYDIEITDAISITGSQSILDQCVDDPNGVNNQFCNLVSRDNIGNISELRAFPLNLNTFTTSGLDLGLRYAFDIGRFGSISNSVTASFLDDRTQILSSDNNIDIIAGELGDPELQINYRGTYIVNDWEVFLELRWIDEMFIEEQELLFGSSTNNDPNPDVTDNTIADSVIYADLGVSYSLDSGLTLGVTIDNVFDEDVPFGLTGRGEGSGTYNNIGRFYLARATWDF